jgi:hypothetical protein
MRVWPDKTFSRSELLTAMFIEHREPLVERFVPTAKTKLRDPEDISVIGGGTN